MAEFVYQALESLGYTHPIHPVLTHVPIGMTIGAILFALTAKIFRTSELSQTARHCGILALLMLPPTALLGILDWQHFYGGSMLLPIKIKFVLASLLLLFLILATVSGRKQRIVSNGVLLLYMACLFSAIGLGYFGGELVYGSKNVEAEMPEGLASTGASVFQQNCSACHFTDSTATKVGPGLKGVFKRDKFPVSGHSATEENFRKQLVAPYDKMPPFGHLSEEEVAAVIAYMKTL